MAAYEDDGLLFSKLLFKVFKVGQHVQTVNAAVGPEVNHHKLPSELAVHGQRLRIKPCMGDWELGHLQLLSLRSRLVFLLFNERSDEL